MASIRSSLPLIPLRPFPLASIILLSTFLAVSLVTVGVRTYIRCRDSHFGLDDAFILVGTVCIHFRSVESPPARILTRADTLHCQHHPRGILLLVGQWQQ